jgi:MFS family permease
MGFTYSCFAHVLIAIQIFLRSVPLITGDNTVRGTQSIPSQGVGMGIGLGMTFVPTVSINHHHFKRRRGLAAGIGLSGSSVGATVFPISKQAIPSLNIFAPLMNLLQ